METGSYITALYRYPSNNTAVTSRKRSPS